MQTDFDKSSSKILLGVDAGGTFTDFICLEFDLAADRELNPRISLRTHKTLSTPDAPELAILNGIKALGLDDSLIGDRLHIIHGSTVATNAALEGKMAATAFITNRGFADMLTLARQTRPELYQLEFAPMAPPVPQDLCLELDVRMDANGVEIEAITESQLQELVAKLASLEIDAVAINLLFSFLDDKQERAIVRHIEQAGLPLFVSSSSQVLPVYREYERGIATWLNAALGPVISGYLRRLQAGIGEASLQIMQSNGETIAATKAAESAVNLLLSGPAGGLTAMQFIGEQIGESQFISFDMGGTSTDVALLSGEIGITSEAHIDRYPVAIPMVDMHTIGAGGGSIAYVDEGGMLQVGPESAGADPGPACYGRGGEVATVTDANLVLGRLLDTASLAGSVPLQIERARAVISTLAKQIGLSVEETASGIVTIANEHMAKAIRMISVNRGHDPARFRLASFGGAGGLHVCAVADAMQMERAIVPVHGGVLSALGMLVADQGLQYTCTVNLPAEVEHEETLFARLQALQEEGESTLQAQGAAPSDCRSDCLADLCYRGQAYTLNVPFESMAAAVDAFTRLHKQRYGYSLENPIQVVNLRVNVHWPQQRFVLPELAGESAESGTKLCNKAQTARVYGGVYGETGEVTVWQREQIPVNKEEPGPAIVCDQSATTYIASGWTFRRDQIGNLLLKKAR